MSDNAFGEQKSPEQAEQKAYQPVQVVQKRGYESLVAVAVMAACAFGVFVVVKLVRFADAAENRLSVVELNQKVIQLQTKVSDIEKRVEAESQRLTGTMENHNKLVQAASGAFATLDAKLTAAEFARTNVVEKVEKEKKR